MKNKELSLFLNKNNLKQVDLAEYWNVSKCTVSGIINGRNKMPQRRIRQLLQNPYGWDTSMLTQSTAPAEEKPACNETLIAELRAQIERLESKVDYLNQELGAKNALIKMLSQGGSGIVRVADGSSSANVG